MKIRDYCDIEAKVDSQGISLRLLTGDVSIPAGGGAWFVPTVCGAGKSTAIARLIRKVGDSGILLLCPTRKDCDTTRKRLINVGMNSDDILVLHTESQMYNDYQQRPSIASMFKVVIVTSIRVNIDVLEPLLDFNGGHREHIIFDELPLFSKELCRFDWKLLAGYVKDTDKLTPRSVEDMIKMKKKFFPSGMDTQLAALRDFHILQLIHDDFSALIKQKKKTVELHQYTKDVVDKWSKYSTIICLDATIDILFTGKAKGCPFKMLQSTDKYSSPVTFKQFSLPAERWVFTEQKVDQSVIDNTLSAMVDIMANQIDSLGPEERILFVAWLYLDYKQCDPDGKLMNDRRIDILLPLSGMLDSRGYSNRYSIIYRGSGDGKGSNDFRDYAAISFLGNWSVNEKSIKTINKNLGIKCDVMSYMTAMMVQNICRLRIRRHDGEPITVFYSSDIDPRLMSRVYAYFKKRSDNPKSITGVPDAQDVVDRSARFIKDMMILCNHVPGLLDAIANRESSFKLDVSLDDMFKWFKKGKMLRSSCKSRCFYNFAHKIKSEYNIDLLINGNPVPKRQ